MKYSKILLITLVSLLLLSISAPLLALTCSNRWRRQCREYSKSLTNASWFRIYRCFEHWMWGSKGGPL